MKNGYYHETGRFAPETAIGTGAAEPVVNEYEAAQAVPSVDESTLGAGKKSKNKPRANENSDIKPSGEDVADDASTLKSTGEEAEVRDNPNAKKSDADVNKLAAEARPAKPQDVQKNSRNAATA